MSSAGLPAAGSLTSRTLVGLSVGAAVLAAVTTVVVPDLLTGPAAMNGSAKGTALVIALGGAPLLAAAYARARRGSMPGLALATGAAAYLVYNALLLVLATPFNRAFLLYEALLGLVVWTFASLVRDVWVRAADLRPPAARWAAGFILGVVAMNLAAWLGNVIPAVLADDPASMLDGTGLTTNPVYVQDLAFWLPACVWIAAGMWRAQGPRTVLGAAALCYWVLESASIAADQWWGHHADPASTVVSTNVVPLFVLVGLATAVVLRSVLRTLSSTTTAGVGSRPASRVRAPTGSR